MTLSRYVAELVCGKIGYGWPEGYFTKIVGGWRGEPLERPAQGDYETRLAWGQSPISRRKRHKRYSRRRGYAGK